MILKPHTTSSVLDELFDGADRLPEPINVQRPQRETLALQMQQQGDLQSALSFQEGELTGDPLNPIVESLRNERYSSSRLGMFREEASRDEFSVSASSDSSGGSEISVSDNTVTAIDNLRILDISGTDWIVCDEIAIGLQLVNGVISLTRSVTGQTNLIAITDCPE